MTEQEHLDKLDEQQHNFDKRQESFETFVRAYLDSNEKNMQYLREKMDKIDDRMHNLTIATAFGVATIVIAVVLSR